MTYDPLRDIASSVINAQQKGVILRMGRVITVFTEDTATYANLEMVGNKVVPHVLCCTDVTLAAEDTAWVADMGMGRWLIIGRVAAGRTPAVEPPPLPPPPSTDTTPPSTPTNLVAVPGNSVVSLAWTRSPEGDTAGYYIYRDTVRINQILWPEPTYLDGGVVNGIEYDYTVAAVDNSGNVSAQTSVVSATPTAAPTPPEPPPVSLPSRRFMFDLYVPTGGIIVTTRYPKHGQNALPVAQRIFAASVAPPYALGRFVRVDLDLYVVVGNTTGAITFDLYNITTSTLVKQITVANNTAPNAQGHIRATSAMTGLTFLDGQEFYWGISAAPAPCKYAANLRVHYDFATS